MKIHRLAVIASVLLTVIVSGCFDENSENGYDISGASAEADPWVQITYPAQWGIVTGMEEVRVDAGPTGEIEFVTLFVDGLSQGADSLAPYSFGWDLDGLSGSHTILAKAFTKIDSVQSSLLTVSISETPVPAPVITSPSNLSTVMNSIMILAEETQAADVDSVVLYIDGLRFGIDTDVPYQFSWVVPVDADSHTLYVRSWAESQSGISPLVTVFSEAGEDSELPYVQITSPADWAQVNGEIEVLAEAHDNVGIDSVILLLDGLEYATLLSAPFRFQVDTEPLTGDNHTLICKAFDPSGNFNISNLVTFVVTP